VSSDRLYNWRIGGPLPRIARHSLAKHRVLLGYLGRYVDHLTRTPAQETLRLTLVDGFAGGGLYADDEDTQYPGSPLLMLQAMEEAQCRCARARTKEFFLDCEYHFVEARRSNFQHLRHVLNERGYGRQIGQNILLHHGQFEERAEQLISRILERGRAGRAIFVLDQYGYTDVPFGLIRQILTCLPHAEIILTFATDWLIDYLADTEEVRNTLAGLELPHRLEELLELRSLMNGRQQIQFILHQHLVQVTGARFYTPFFIRSEEAHRDYWLVHLSNHHRGDPSAKVGGPAAENG
jgi:three-Cys-motif partner protein